MLTLGFRLYQLMWFLLGPFVPLLLRIRGRNGKEDLSRKRERFGYASSPRPKNLDRLFWLHGASVGETVSSLVLAKAMIDDAKSHDRPIPHILITSGTITSAKMLQSRIESLELSAHITHQFHPYDHPLWIKRFLDHWQPDLAVMMESEIWPNMVMKSAERGIPVAMASAQISTKSMQVWSGYGHVLARNFFPLFEEIYAVDAVQQARFDSLPTQPFVVKIGGSMKAAAPALADNPALRQQISDAADGRMVVLLASSHDGEEALFLDAMSAINQSGAFLSIIAPRHLNRSQAIRQLVDREGHEAGQLQLGDTPSPTHQVFIADVMGEIGSLTRAADIIVLGGAFAPLGGHNPMEMAALGKGIISGPEVFKNASAFELLSQHGGVITASSASEIAEAITVLAASDTVLKRHNQGAINAHAVLADAAQQTAQGLTQLAERKSKRRGS